MVIAIGCYAFVGTWSSANLT